LTARSIASIILIALLLPLFLIGCGKKEYQKAYIYCHLPGNYSRYLAEVLNGEAEEHGYQLEVINITDRQDYNDSLFLSVSGKLEGPVLVLVPPECLRKLAKDSLVIGLSSVFDPDQLVDKLKGFDRLALQSGVVRGRLEFLPYSLECRLMFYRRSKVREALSAYQKYTREIDSLFRTENLLGLPAGYQLEIDPAKWDYYDLFAAGYFWSRDAHEFQPRMAHCGGYNWCSMAELMVKSLCFGADTDDLFDPGADYSTELIRWESMYYKHGVYNRASQSSAWDTGKLAELFMENSLYLCNFEPVDIWGTILNGSERIDGDVEQAGDLAAAVMPRAVSLDVNINGRPEKIGYQYSNLDGFWIGIPVNSPNKDISVTLMNHLISETHQKEICRRFGAYPVLKKLSEDFRGCLDADWKVAVMNMAKKQFAIGAYPFPARENLAHDPEVFYRAYYNLSFERMLTDPMEINNELYRMRQK
jgi:ABC-type glycerol-3-phosphate transport system substrate-binding protein